MPTNYESPKEQFIKSQKQVEAHRFIVSHAQFEPSIGAALLEMNNQLLRQPPENANEASMNGMLLAGAHKFIEILRNLSEVPAPVKQPQFQKLHQT